MTHTHTHTLVMCWVLGGVGLWVTSPAPAAEDLFWLAHRGCQCRFFFFTGGDCIYLFVLLLVPPEESVLSAPEREAVNGI